MPNGRRRSAELAGNVARVRQRVAAAAVAAGRDPSEVTIVAITKTRPASDVRLLAQLGITHVGENRDQEARTKAGDCADLALTWHFVGQLQRNKAASVVRYVDIVESVDRASLVDALDRAAVRGGRRLGACIQVDLAGNQVGRGGADPEHAQVLADRVAASEALDLLGVMAIAPLGQDSGAAFGRLAAVHDQIISRHPGAVMRSAGMSGDLEAAIAAGATHVRPGSALLGPREPLK